MNHTDLGALPTQIGDQDLKDLINESIELARVGDGTKLDAVHGTMNCNTSDVNSPLNGTIIWSLRYTEILGT